MLTTDGFRLYGRVALVTGSSRNWDVDESGGACLSLSSSAGDYVGGHRGEYGFGRMDCRPVWPDRGVPGVRCRRGSGGSAGDGGDAGDPAKTTATSG